MFGPPRADTQPGLAPSSRSYYYAQVSVGTPKQNFNIVLDTGSADFWVVDTACGRLNGCSFGLNKYDSSKSSSYVGSNAPFMIQYGSGATRGTLAAETVSLAGYTINSLTFAQADAIASGTVEPPASGIMGMGFQSLSSSGATPFWEVLVKQGKLSSNSFSFTLARNIGTVSSATATSPGGIFTLGEIDKNQYTGNINYVDIPNGLENQIGLGYWTIPMDALNVNNNNIPIGNGEATYSAIDTGTTLIGGPNAAVASLYNSIQGSQPLGGNMQGYYSFPCDADINASITFGGQAYPINSTDLNLGTIDASGQNCLGGFFEVGDIGGQGAPTWIVGDVFLKNVFSVYQYSPAAVGFASLPGNQAATESVTASAVPSGTAAASGSGSASATASSSSADGGLPLPSISRSSGTGGSGTAVQAGFTGLPAPSAASTNIATSPSNTAGSGSAGSGSSGAANVYAPAALTAGIAALGAVVALF